MKKCDKCKKDKTLLEFYKDKRRKDGKRIDCRDCCKKYRQNNKAKEKAKEYNKEYRQNNREKIKEKKKEYYQNNLEKIKEKDKEYGQNNREKIKNTQLKRKYGITLNERNEMERTQNYKCAICNKKKELVVDHCHKSGNGTASLITDFFACLVLDFLSLFDGGTSAFSPLGTLDSGCLGFLSLLSNDLSVAFSASLSKSSSVIGSFVVAMSLLSCAFFLSSSRGFTNWIAVSPI